MPTLTSLRLGYFGKKENLDIAEKMKVAFSECSNLTSVVIPDSVTSIGSMAFDDCNSLSSVTIGNGLTSIGSDAFDKLRTITFYVPTDKSTAYKTLLENSILIGDFPGDRWTITETTSQ